MFYIGTYYHTLDAKNRIFIPSRYREALGDSFVIFRGPEQCLYLYDEQGWDEVLASIQGHSDSPKKREQLRVLYSRVDVGGPDKSGRVTLSAEAVKHAGLKDDVVIIGMGNRFEVWDKETWDALESDGSLIEQGIAF